MAHSNTPSPAHRLLAVVLVAAVTGVLFGSGPILAWTEQLPPTMSCQAEMTVPYNTVRALERQVENYRFVPAPDQ